MEMLIFYVVAIMLSAYETNKEQQPEAAVEKNRNWSQQYNNASCTR